METIFKVFLVLSTLATSAILGFHFCSFMADIEQQSYFEELSNGIK